MRDISRNGAFSDLAQIYDHFQQHFLIFFRARVAKPIWSWLCPRIKWRDNLKKLKTSSKQKHASCFLTTYLLKQSVTCVMFGGWKMIAIRQWIPVLSTLKNAGWLQSLAVGFTVQWCLISCDISVFDQTGRFSREDQATSSHRGSHGHRSRFRIWTPHMFFLLNHPCSKHFSAYISSDQ